MCSSVSLAALVPATPSVRPDYTPPESVRGDYDAARSYRKENRRTPGNAVLCDRPGGWTEGPPPVIAPAQRSVPFRENPEPNGDRADRIVYRHGFSYTVGRSADRFLAQRPILYAFHHVEAPPRKTERPSPADRVSKQAPVPLSMVKVRLNCSLASSGISHRATRGWSITVSTSCSTSQNQIQSGSLSLKQAFRIRSHVATVSRDVQRPPLNTDRVFHSSAHSADQYL